MPASGSEPAADSPPSTPPASAMPRNITGTEMTKRIGIVSRKNAQARSGTTSTCTLLRMVAMPAPIIAIDCVHSAKSRPRNTPPRACRATVRRDGAPFLRISA
ncbi:hypothetical protein GCM10023353_33640 [Tomitella cavernea]|uniref:Uncharacterized protein n=1 Tax=Tomitella cavernea TaxID=1387982 RepID=A0ABP9D4B8_9ACTN